MKKYGSWEGGLFHIDTYTPYPPYALKGRVTFQKGGNFLVCPRELNKEICVFRKTFFPEHFPLFSKEKKKEAPQAPKKLEKMGKWEKMEKIFVLTKK